MIMLQLNIKHLGYIKYNILALLITSKFYTAQGGLENINERL